MNLKIQFYNRYAEDELCLYLLYVYIRLLAVIRILFLVTYFFHWKTISLNLSLICKPWYFE